MLILSADRIHHAPHNNRSAYGWSIDLWVLTSHSRNGTKIGVGRYRGPLTTIISNVLPEPIRPPQSRITGQFPPGAEMPVIGGSSNSFGRISANQWNYKDD